MAQSVSPVLSAVTLTAAFSGNMGIIRVAPGPVGLLVAYTRVSATALEIQVEMSDDGSTWYLPTISAGTSVARVLTVGASGNYRLAPGATFLTNETLGPLLSGESHLRISARETGTPGGTVTVKALYVPIASY